MNEKLKQKNKISVFLILLGIILIFSASFMLFNYKKPNEYEYNGFTFSKIRLESAPKLVFHQLRVYNGDSVYEIPFRNGPEGVESIPVVNLSVAWLKQLGGEDVENYNILAKSVYLTFNPKLSGGDLAIAGGEIAKVLGTSNYGIYKVPTGGAVTESIEEKTAVVRTCDNATKDMGVILLSIGYENKIYSEGDCVIIQGTNYVNLIRSADRFIYELLGIL